MGRASRRKRERELAPTQSAREARARFLDEVVASVARDAQQLEAPKMYRGSLTDDEAAQGAAFAFDNARLLLRAAEELSAEGAPAAAALAVLAMEEAAKIPILRAISECTTDEGRQRRWSDYSDHRAKIAAVNAPYGDPQATVGHRMQLLRHLKALGHHFETLKEMAIYTAPVLEDRIRWNAPATFPTETISSVMEMARLVLVRRKSGVTEDALWIRFVRPHVEAGSDVFCSGLARLETEAIRLHLRDITDEQELALMRARRF